MIVHRGLRLAWIAWLAVRVAASYGMARARAGSVPLDRRAAWWSATHRANAERIYRTSVRLRGAFLKVGQFVSTRIDLVPPEYVEVLSRLQDQVPPLPYAVIAAQLRHELGKEPDEAFAWFDHQPVAAASLGQVHEARTADGVRVAVKVQFPHMEPIVLGDLENLRLGARLAARFRFARHLDVVGIANELVRYVGEEVDYVQEGRNAERFHEAFKSRPDVVVPRIHWETTTRRVITMDFIEGRRITTDLQAAERAGDAGRERIDRVCTTLVDAFCKQTLEDGFFHADPHPGNFLVTPDGRLGLVDFGCAKPIPIEAREDYVKLAQALVQKDGATMARCFHALGFRTRDDDPAVLEQLGSTYMAVFMAERASDFRGLDFEKLWRDMMSSVRANPVTVPQDFVMLGRVFVALTAITLEFRPNVSYFRILAPYLLNVLMASRARAPLE